MGQALDILGVGISAVDDLLYINDVPAVNAKYPVQDSARSGGGLAAVAMVAAARLGARAAYVARFDGGELSAYMTGILKEQGVITDRILRDPQGQPYHSIIVVDKATGSRTIFYDCRKFKQPTVADISEDVIRSAKVFFMDFLAEPVPVELARKVKHAGVPIVADVEGRHPNVGALLELIDYLVVSEEFAQWKTGQQDLKAACAELARGPRKATVVTAGANGCWWTDAATKAPAHVPAFKINPIDTTGCGDTYHGAFAYGVAKGFTLEETVVLASACGALKATGRGWTAMPTKQSLETFLRDREPHHRAIHSILHKLG